MFPSRFLYHAMFTKPSDSFSSFLFEFQLQINQECRDFCRLFFDILMCLQSTDFDIWEPEATRDLKSKFQSTTTQLSRNEFSTFRMFWIVILLFALLIFVFLISTTTEKHLTTQIVMKPSKTQMSVGEIPFPAVTFCPEPRISASIMESNEKDLE
jgi:hypothetical protein